MASSSARNMGLFISYLCALFLCFCLQNCSARDSITPRTPINSTSGETLISAGKIFELGFFTRISPDTSTNNTYIGIWYYQLSSPRVTVWVANRDKPLTNFGILKVEDGNLVLSDENGRSIFSTGVSVSNNSYTKVKLLDSGNLVLTLPGKLLWQSFEHPTDTFLPGMRLVSSLNLTSWRSHADPGRGNFTFGQADSHTTVIWNGTKKYWISGEWGDFASYTDMILVVESLLVNSRSTTTTETIEDVPYLSFNITKTSSFVSNYNYTRLVINSSGEIQFWNLSGDSRDKQWYAPQDRQCSLYNFCGDFGICKSQSIPLCKCLMSTLEPRSPDNWNSGDFSSGCKRTSLSAFSEKDEFSVLPTVRVARPDRSLEADNETDCRNKCLRDQNCQACSYTEDGRDRDVSEKPGKAGACWLWTNDLQNLVENATLEGRDLNVRIPLGDPGHNSSISDHPNRKEKSISLKKAILYMGLFINAVVLCSIGYSRYRERMLARRRESRGRRSRESSQAPGIGIYDTERRVRNLMDSGGFKEEDRKDIDVPFFDLESIVEATDYFSDEHKLGQGGFGPVYKGKFPGGKEIAVKRLSSHSGQGLEEFKNEVVLIAKLQHRNLVRLLGYCIVGNEKILLYEYMPNKSLDAFIFDRTRCLTLDWEQRFNIISGIGRGLLYLHHDSRLRIIHRDLKTSNILLDEEMNPKISDFGLARIVTGKELEASTNRVVGTYGYMSPEYALDGLFSIKSDVFSFGVIILEIISGKRNTGFYQSQQAQNLLSYAWRLWREEKALDLMDRSLLSSCNEGEVLKCITIGLLCVQENPNDRPTMSKALFMLGSETATLPNPKEPAFLIKMWSSSSPSSSSTKPESLSITDMTAR